MSDIYRMFVRPEGKDGERGADLMEQYGDAMAQAAVAHLASAPADRVIEIGFGPGLGLQVLARKLVHGHATGVDPSALMNRRAALRNGAAIRAGRMTLIEGTVNALPFPEATFDAALAMDNLHFWPERLAGLTELRRVLKPGAPFLCCFTPPSGGSTSGLAKSMSAAGFVDIVLLDWPEGQAIRARKPN